MENPNNACLANKAFQCLLNIGFVKEAVINVKNENDVKA